MVCDKDIKRCVSTNFPLLTCEFSTTGYRFQSETLLELGAIFDLKLVGLKTATS